MYSIKFCFGHTDRAGNALEQWQIATVKRRITTELGSVFHTGSFSLPGDGAYYNDYTNELEAEDATMIETIVADDALVDRHAPSLLRLAGEIAWFLQQKTVFVLFAKLDGQLHLVTSLPPSGERRVTRQLEPLEETC